MKTVKCRSHYIVSANCDLGYYIYMAVVFFIFPILYMVLGITAPVSAADMQTDPARAAGLVPHKALYDVRLSSKKSSAKVANISGKMSYEWQPTCDAWISNHRFNMVYEYIEAPPMNITSDFSTYESFDGKDFNFTMQRKHGDDLFEEFRGSASDSEVVYSIPDGLAFDMPEGSLFPMGHTLAVLKEIRANKKFYKTILFDGSDEDGPMDVNTFIAKPATYKLSPKHNPEDIDKTLLEAKGWSLRLAFFPLSDFEVTSDYEMSLIFHENGVISDMEIDYGDFSVTQKLLAIEVLGDACLSEDEKDVE